MDLRNKGWSYRRIMGEFADKNGKPLFSWTVIEREIMFMREKRNAEVIVPGKKSIKMWSPSDFELERRTVWRFERRGTWAVHNNDYRGNWPPQIPRNLLLKFTSPKDVVIDPFCGGGTTLIEAWLTGRRSWGIDINPTAVEISRQRIQQMSDHARKTLDLKLDPECRPVILRGDARELVAISQKKSVPKARLACIHPPYLDTLRYTETVEGDLSRISDIETFLKEIRKVAKAVFQNLEPDGYAAVLIGDIRRNGRTFPLGCQVSAQFVDEGFVLNEIVIKEQFRDESTEFYYSSKSLSYLIAHEYLFLFRREG